MREQDRKDGGVRMYHNIQGTKEILASGNKGLALADAMEGGRPNARRNKQLQQGREN